MAPLAPLTIESVRVGGTQSIRLGGELDATVTPLLEQELMRVEEGDAESIVIDLCGLDRLDSSGLRLLLTASARSRQHGGRLALLRGPDHVHRLFERTGLVSRLPFARPDR